MDDGVLAGEGDDITDVEGTFGQEVDAGHQVLQQFLQGEAGCQPQDTDGGGERGDADTEEKEYDQRPDHQDEGSQQAPQENGHAGW